MKNLSNLKNSLAIAALLIFGLTLNSCSSDDDSNNDGGDIINPPVINTVGIEIGYDNNHTGTPGEDLHLDVEIEAEGRIATIAIELHKEDGSGEEYEFEWTEFEGLLNLDFHEHYEIPATATTGEYHFHFVVTDMEGNQTSYEEEFEMVNGPVINTQTMEIGENNSHTGTPGTDLHLDVEVQADAGISTIAIELHNEADSSEEYEYEWTFAGQTTLDFHDHYEIPATATTGEYHFHFIVTDTLGNQTVYDAEFDMEN